MKARCTLLLGLALFTSCATSTSIPRPAGEGFLGDLKAFRSTLANGLRVVIVPDSSSPTFSYQTWFRVGSRNEVRGYTGLAHLFEHMMFKGTKTHEIGHFDRTLERAGAEGLNAFTSHDYTAYIQELPKDQLELIMGLESDRMTQLIVDDAAFKTEREVVQNERRDRVENNPDGLMYQEMFSTAYQSHSYSWPVIGYDEDLKRMTAEDGYKFYRTHYAPNNATIVIVGDVEPEATLALVKKYYGSFTSSIIQSPPIPVEPAISQPRRKTLKLPIKVEKLYMAYAVPAVDHPDIGAIEVLQGILTEGKSARLTRALVESGISASVDSGNLMQTDPSIFMIGSGLQLGKKASSAETMIVNELSRIARDGISQAEVQRALNQMNFNFYNGLNSNSSRANFIGRFESQLGHFERGFRIQRDMAGVTPADVQRVVQKYFQPQSRVTILGVAQ